jgi:integrase
MSIRYDSRNKRWRFEFDRYHEGRRHRSSKLLPAGWSRAQADAYDRKEGARLSAIASGIAREEPLIDEAVIHYLRDKTHLKSYKSAAEHLGAIAWAYAGRTVGDLSAVAREVAERSSTAPATTRNRLALLKAACRWAWKKHGLTEHDPTGRMQLPQVDNERHVYLTRKQMLTWARECTNWEGQIAIRVGFYTGLRLGELFRVEPHGNILLMPPSKNGDRRGIPIHPKISHLKRFLPLTSKKHTVQAACFAARDRLGLGDVHFHDLRHSAASEMVNAGVPLYDVGKILGHRDTRSTQRYSHLTADRLMAAVIQIGRKRA